MTITTTTKTTTIAPLEQTLDALTTRPQVRVDPLPAEYASIDRIASHALFCMCNYPLTHVPSYALAHGLLHLHVHTRCGMHDNLLTIATVWMSLDLTIDMYKVLCMRHQVFRWHRMPCSRKLGHHTLQTSLVMTEIYGERELRPTTGHVVHTATVFFRLSALFLVTNMILHQN